MEQPNSQPYLSDFEQKVLSLQAYGATMSLLGSENSSEPDMSTDELKSQFSSTYLTAFQYLAGISLQQPKLREVMGGLEERISNTGTTLADILKGDEEKQIFLDRMYADSVRAVYGEGEEGAIEYITSQMEAQKVIDSQIANHSDKIDPQTLEQTSLLRGLYKKMIAQQTMGIYGAIPEKTRHLLVDYSGDRDAA